MRLSGECLQVNAPKMNPALFNKGIVVSNLKGKKVIVRRVINEALNGWMIGATFEIVRERPIRSSDNYTCYTVEGFYEGQTVRKNVFVDACEIIEEDDNIIVLKRSA